MKSNIQPIRHATIDDVPAIFEIRTSVRENGASRQRLYEIGINEEFVATAITSEGRGWIAEDEGRPVGFSIADSQGGSIFALYVLPEFEGRGHGDNLLTSAVAWLFDQGFTRLLLTVGPNTRAHRFYLKRGWSPTGATEPNGDVELELRSRAIRSIQSD